MGEQPRVMDDNNREREKIHTLYTIYIYRKLDEPDMQDTAGEAEMNS